MIEYLKGFGVQFHYDTKVTDVRFNIQGSRKMASSVTVEHAGEVSNIDLTENDLLFITNGGCVESCTVGAQDKAAVSTPPSSRATAGICGRRSPHRTRPSATPKSSARIRSCPTGRAPPSPPWMTRSRSISRRSASAIPSAVTPSPAASLRSRTPAGCSAGR